MNNPTNGGRRGRHRRRWTATGLLLGVPAIVVPYFLFVQEDSQAATVDGDAYYRLVSVRSGKVLDVNSFSTADGTRIQQWTDQNTANQQWRLKPTGDGYYELVNRNSGKVLGIAGDSTAEKAAAEQQTDSSSTSQEWRIGDVSGSDAVTFTSRKSGLVLDVSGGSTAQGATVMQYSDRGSTNQQWKLVKSAQTQAAGAGTGGAQTTAAAGPYVWNNAQVVGGGYVTGLVFNPREKGLLYARTDMGGAYRWDAAAEQWIPLTDWVGEKDWNLLGIDSLATDPVDPDRFYAAAGTYTNGWAGNAELLRSTDRGRTFKRTALPFKLGANEHGRGAGERLAINPSANGTLLLGTRKNGLWRSTDHGVTWSQVSSFPVKDGASSGAGIAFVTYGPAGSKTVYVGVADKSTSLYRSTDGGSTWQAVSGQPTGDMPQHGVISGDGSLYLTYANSIGDATAGSVWKYTPDGGAWKDISPSQGNYGFSGLAVDPQKPSTVMVSTLHRWWPQDELYRSTDGGTTWKAQAAKSERDASGAPYVGTGVGHWMTAMAIDPFNSGHVLYGTGGGIWRSKDANATDNGGTSHWTVGARGLEETALFDAIAPPGGATVITAMGDLGGFRHDSLTKVPAGRLDNPMMITSTDIDFAQSKPSMMVRVGRGGKQDGAYSADGGNSWNGFKAEPVDSAASGQVALAADGSAIVWTQAGQAPYRSTDKGASWSKVSGLGNGAVVVADRSSAKTFYSLHGGKLYASTDGGATFTARATSLPDGRLAAVPGIAGDLWISGSGKGLLHSTDGGRTFTTLTTVKSASALGFGKAAPGADYQALYLIGTVKDVTGVFRSTDKGATWLRVNDDAHQWGSIGGVGVVTGDPDTFGRVYVGTNGRGLQYGDPS
ncbi:RICIN domain-containing protein [Streptomyces bobili]|uniref:RICIN domain-containing protein n=1 Tax=Streptomyces bobili TaxID=67280 RepID=UPI0036FCE772